MPFKEGTIELNESAEEAVVAKRARVVEEVVISKEGSDQTQTVHDTVRKTDVDVKKVDTPTKVVATRPSTPTTPTSRSTIRPGTPSTGYSYDQFTPAYRFGHNLAGDERYQGDWAAVEPQARTPGSSRTRGPGTSSRTPSTTPGTRPAASG